MTDDICCVYLARMGNMVKIGISNDHARRLAQLQTGAPEPITMPFVLVTESRAYAADLEKRLHKRLASRRTHGEWFRIDIDDAIEALDRAVARRIAGRPRRSFPSVAAAMAWAEPSH